MASVAGQPIFAVVGEAVLYRDLELNSRGSDVLGFENALSAARVIASADAVLDQSTIDAWRRAVDDSGPRDAIALSTLVVVPPHARVARVDVAVGAPVRSGTTLLTVHSGSEAFTCTGQHPAESVSPEQASLEVDGRSFRVARIRSGPASGGEPADLVVSAQRPVRGDVAQLAITSDESAGPVLVVPLNAIQTASDGTTAVVVVDGKDRRSVKVRLGVSSQGLVEVTSHQLQQGQRVILFGVAGQPSGDLTESTPSKS